MRGYAHSFLCEAKTRGTSIGDVTKRKRPASSIQRQEQIAAMDRKKDIGRVDSAAPGSSYQQEREMRK